MDRLRDKPYGPYAEWYENFFRNSGKHKGYDFHERISTSVAPPMPTFSTPVRWYSLDRARRLAEIRRLRDQFQEDILRYGEFHNRCRPTPSKPNADIRPGQEEGTSGVSPRPLAA